MAEQWGLGRERRRFAGLISQGRAGPGGPRVAVLLPQTYMNEAGRSAGPARGALRLPLERVLVIHDDIDLPFGDVRHRVGGGLAGHNGLKSLARELGGTGFARVRIGVGRPEATDPRVVSDYVLSRFSEPVDDVRALVERAGEVAQRTVLARPPPERHGGR